MELTEGIWYFLNGYYYHDGEPSEDLGLEIKATDDIEKVIETLSNTLRTIHAKLNSVGICNDGISCDNEYEGILNENGHCEDCVTERDYENDYFWNPNEE
jgi:hypothetical protein